jgi:flagellar hook assembly protein FlgD
VAEAEALAYRLVHPATVQATLVGPDGTSIPFDSGARVPGTYGFTWSGALPDGSRAAEGLWRFTVTATEESGQVSQTDRTFTLNNTLASLKVGSTSVKLRNKATRLGASFSLTRAAKITATIETRSGVVIRVLSRTSLGAGRHSVTWNGRTAAGTLAFGGSYLVHVDAANALGSVDLHAAFTARR